MEAELERSQVSEIVNAEVVRGATTQPITFRASAPLLARLDSLAAKEHRTRANLIQHILWLYIHEHESKKR
jgi:predicted DNA-binding protein